VIVKKLALHAAAPALVAAVILVPASAGAAVLPPGGPLGNGPAPAPRAAAPTTESFDLATFNVQGGSHTSAHGRSSGTSRMKGDVSYLRKHKVRLAGFQELEQAQASSFRKRTKGRWALVGAPSRSGRSTDTRNAVAFRKSYFTLRKKTSVPMWYFHGKRVNIPLVQLRSRSTGKLFWILNTHNPADVHGPAGHWRAKSLKRELKAIHRLRAQGQTVLFTGDMNDKQAFFCPATRSGMLHAASGGSTGKKCRYPSRNGIDWLLGTRDVRFTKWRADSSTVSRGLSDHPIVVARATLKG
jgi:hypothetical protein